MCSRRQYPQLILWGSPNQVFSKSFIASSTCYLYSPCQQSTLKHASAMLPRITLTSLLEIYFSSLEKAVASTALIANRLTSSDAHRTTGQPARMPFPSHTASCDRSGRRGLQSHARHLRRDCSKVSLLICRRKLPGASRSGIEDPLDLVRQFHFSQDVLRSMSLLVRKDLVGFGRSNAQWSFHILELGFLHEGGVGGVASIELAKVWT